MLSPGYYMEILLLAAHQFAVWPDITISMSFGAQFFGRSGQSQCQILASKRSSRMLISHQRDSRILSLSQIRGGVDFKVQINDTLMNWI
ncbi:unnamed protein product [Hymenolepis diminuta]|uniref:Uncharacterized protein n=1 Tax=Hymenolepis diminuta TaxID=6216 RepID=A0A564YY41_HYMDI|nr:unnamed protein product [Hymenolepis diminuta]